MHLHLLPLFINPLFRLLFCQIVVVIIFGGKKHISAINITHITRIRVVTLHRGTSFDLTSCPFELLFCPFCLHLYPRSGRVRLRGQWLLAKYTKKRHRPKSASSESMCIINRIYQYFSPAEASAPLQDSFLLFNEIAVYQWRKNNNVPEC